MATTKMLLGASRDFPPTGAFPRHRQNLGTGPLGVLSLSVRWMSSTPAPRLRAQDSLATALHCPEKQACRRTGLGPCASPCRRHRERCPSSPEPGCCSGPGSARAAPDRANAHAGPLRPCAGLDFSHSNCIDCRNSRRPTPLFPYRRGSIEPPQLQARGCQTDNLFLLCQASPSWSTPTPCSAKTSWATRRAFRARGKPT